MSKKANPWIQTLDTGLWNKSGSIHPSNPQVDIQTTGSCEFWIRNADLVRYKPKSTTKPCLNTNPPPLILPEIYSSRVPCTNEELQDMMAPERLNILHTAFHTAKLKGLHNNTRSAPKSFTSELLGLLSRKTELERKDNNKKIKDSHSQALPTHVRTAVQKWALVVTPNHRRRHW